MSRVALLHPWAGFCKSKNKMATRYFKVKYDFSTNEARNKCNTSFSCDFDWAIHFLCYFYDSRSASRSKSQFQGQISKLTILTNNRLRLGTHVIPHFYEILTEKLNYSIIGKALKDKEKILGSTHMHYREMRGATEMSMGRHRRAMGRR